ncbi:MAG: type II/IV secretion system protein [Bdellovibrionales bacterium]|nr:type II/IV secretion system protein [Bdellovibrionales bacterium]
MATPSVYQLVPPRARPTNVQEIVDFILINAIRTKASDLHFGLSAAPGGGALTYLLRFRVHGKLQPVKTDFIGQSHKEILTRLKVLANISTTEIGVPQDGQIAMNTPEGSLVLRLSFVPNPEGEEVVIRLQRAQKIPPPEQLGMTGDMLKSIQTLLQQKSGMIVINGPAGSGKTTTIYSLLTALSSPERKIVTAEDPIELRLPYVSHTAVGKNTSFAQLSKAFMRQDADVIFIGEVRDPESAEAAVQLAQTGHLVFTTLHTRDALGVVPRLEAFGIHPNFIASSLIGSLAQRLVSRLCPKCRVPATLDDATLLHMKTILPMSPAAKVMQAGPGCQECIGGYQGRMPVYELLTVTPPISDLINRRASQKDLAEAARDSGMLTLAQEALIRVYSGQVEYSAVKGYLSNY